VLVARWVSGVGEAAVRLPRRPRGRPADHGGGRRRLHGNLPRPQPAPCAGRPADRAMR
jgi:hypothetical protein